MLLAGDIGGTKALLALSGPDAIWFERRYASREFASFDALLARFRADAQAALGAAPEIERACLGVAGPVTGGRVKLTNLAWEIDASELGIPDTRLLNDFAASAHGLHALGTQDLTTLQAGSALAGAPRLLIGAGTGLGVAFVAGSGRDMHVITGEGGHAAFAPADELQDALLRHLHSALGRVELEHVISGAGLARIYAFLRDRGHCAGGEATQAALAGADPAPVIVAAALECGDSLALAALDLFIACYGAAAGDYALAVLARGGAYLTGGVAAKILPRLRAGGFVAAFNAKGAFASTVRNCPVHVVTNERLGLLGAVTAANCPSQSNRVDAS